MKKEDIYLDLSKLSEEERKSIPQILEKEGGKVLPETLSDLISGKITDGFKFLFYSPSGWNQNDYPLNARTELTYPEFIKLFEGGEGEKEKKVKIVFGLEAQGHIPTIEAELKRWNDSFNADYPDHKTKDTMTYSKDVWESIGKKIGWCPFTASLAYFNWLKNKD